MKPVACMNKIGNLNIQNVLVGDGLVAKVSVVVYIPFTLCFIFKTRSSADADNRLDAFSGQSRSTNMVPFHM